MWATITRSAANDGQQTEELLKALVIKPPPPDTPVQDPDPRDLPTAPAAKHRSRQARNKGTLRDKFMHCLSAAMHTIQEPRLGIVSRQAAERNGLYSPSLAAASVSTRTERIFPK